MDGWAYYSVFEVIKGFLAICDLLEVLIFLQKPIDWFCNLEVIRYVSAIVVCNLSCSMLLYEIGTHRQSTIKFQIAMKSCSALNNPKIWLLLFIWAHCLLADNWRWQMNVFSAGDIE